MFVSLYSVLTDFNARGEVVEKRPNSLLEKEMYAFGI